MLVPDESRQEEVTAGKIMSGMLVLLIIAALVAAGLYLIMHM